MPYLDKDKKLPNGVRSYPCREAHGLIFIYPGDPAKQEAAQRGGVAPRGWSSGGSGRRRDKVDLERSGDVKVMSARL